MSWNNPPFGIAGMILLVMGSFNGFALLLSVLIETQGLPESWSVQRVKRKPGALKAHLPLIGLNLFLLHALALPSFYLAQDYFPFENPGVAGILAFVAVVLIDDTGFYFTHRLLHENRWLYKNVHRLHHRAYAPTPIEYIYAHPLEWMMGAIAPVGAIVLVILVTGQFNAWVLLTWVAFRVTHEVDVHSGTRSWLGEYIPLFAPTRHHDLHHARPNDGNYATTLTLWDRILGTLVAMREKKRAA